MGFYRRLSSTQERSAKELSTSVKRGAQRMIAATTLARLRIGSLFGSRGCLHPNNRFGSPGCSYVLLTCRLAFLRPEATNENICPERCVICFVSTKSNQHASGSQRSKAGMQGSPLDLPPAWNPVEHKDFYQVTFLCFFFSVSKLALPGVLTQLHGLLLPRAQKLLIVFRPP